MKSYLIEEVVKATAQQHPRQTDSDLWGLQLEQTFVSTVQVLCQDRELVLAAVTQKGGAVRFAWPIFQDNELCVFGAS